MAEIRAVIWDMGGILYPTPFELLDDLETSNGWAPGTLPRGPFSPEGDPEYAKCSTGELTESEYWRRYQRASAANGHPLDLKREIDWTGTERPEVMATIETLGRRFRQATLSNDSSEWLGYGWWDSWPFAHLFCHVIDVVTLGVRKPHPVAYTTTAERMGLEAGECLFVDDMQINIEGAEAVGMPGFFFDHTEVATSCSRLVSYLDRGYARQREIYR